MDHVGKGYRLEPAALAEPVKKRDSSKARAMIALLVWCEDHLSLTELGTRLGRNLCSLSHAENRLRKRAEKNPRMTVELERMKEEPR